MKSNGHRSTSAVFAVAVFLLAVTPLAVVAADRFTDVGDDNVFHDDIKWMVENNLTTGKDDGTFGPARAVTRQAMAAFLYRAATLPAAG